MYKAMIIAGAIACGAVLAQGAARVYSIVVNGINTGEQSAVVAGKTYVPVSVLAKLGYKYEIRENGIYITKASDSSTGGSAVGGANQRSSIEGCIGEQLFNGIWRVKVTGISRTSSSSANTLAWIVSIQLTNGTNRTIAPTHAGINAGHLEQIPVSLALSNGSLATLQARDIGYMLDNTTIPQAASITIKPMFEFALSGESPNNIQPTKLLFEMRPDLLTESAKMYSDVRGLSFSVKDPSFRVNLTCKK